MAFTAVVPLAVAGKRADVAAARCASLSVQKAGLKCREAHIDHAGQLSLLGRDKDICRAVKPSSFGGLEVHGWMICAGGKDNAVLGCSLA